MKKFALSGFVIASFLFYSFHQKQEGSSEKVVVPKSASPTPSTGSSSNSPSGSQTPNGYKDGSFTGSDTDAFYGIIQVKAVIQNGKIVDVQFLRYPNDRETSIQINTQAMPILKQEAIAAQNSKVDIVSGATDSSIAFQKSLQSALNLAKL